jgi:hypothetical protein
MGILACQQPEKRDQLHSPLSLVTEDISYSSYAWDYPLGQWGFYLNYFVRINERGDFSLMLRDTASKAIYYTGTVNDTIRQLINRTFSVDTFTNDYKSKSLQNIAYSGFTYCLDYKKQNEKRKRIVFIQTRSPEAIRSLSIQLDKILGNTKVKEIDAATLAPHIEELKNLALLH